TGVAAGLLHVLLVEPEDLAGDALDLLETVQQPVLLEIVLVALGVAVLAAVKGIALLPITVGQGGQLFYQFAFAWGRDVVLFAVQVVEVVLPVLLVLVPGFLLAAGQGEAEGGVDPLQGLVETLHEEHAVVVVAQDGADAAAEAVQQRDGGAAQHRHEEQQRQDRQQDVRAEGQSHGSWSCSGNGPGIYFDMPAPSGPTPLGPATTIKRNRPGQDPTRILDGRPDSSVFVSAGRRRHFRRGRGAVRRPGPRRGLAPRPGGGRAAGTT